MTQLTSQAVEVLNRNEFLAPFIAAGFIPYIPAWDDGVDFILLRERQKGQPNDLLLKVQLKSRWTVNERKYFRRDIWIAFPEEGLPGKRRWFLMPHDVMVAEGRALHGTSTSWKDGHYSKVVGDAFANAFAKFEVGNLLRAMASQPLSDFTKDGAAGWMPAASNEGSPSSERGEALLNQMSG